MSEDFEFDWFKHRETWQQKGGEGSGHHGHTGVPGQLGGSAPGGAGAGGPAGSPKETAMMGSLASVMVDSRFEKDKSHIKHLEYRRRKNELAISDKGGYSGNIVGRITKSDLEWQRGSGKFTLDDLEKFLVENGATKEKPSPKGRRRGVPVLYD